MSFPPEKIVTTVNRIVRPAIGAETAGVNWKKGNHQRFVRKIVFAETAPAMRVQWKMRFHVLLIAIAVTGRASRRIGKTNPIVPRIVIAEMDCVVGKRRANTA